MRVAAGVLSIVLLSASFVDGKLRNGADIVDDTSSFRRTMRRRLQDFGFFQPVIDLVGGFAVGIVSGALCSPFVPGLLQENFFQCPEDTPVPSLSIAPSEVPTFAPTTAALWDQVGGNVVGATTTTSLGTSISLDDAGEVMVATGNSTAAVYHIFYNEDRLRNWELEKDLSSSVDGPRVACALSRDRRSLALGDPESTSATQGEVVILSNDPDGDAGWAEVVRVVGNTAGDNFGHSLSMSNDGVRTAAAAPGKYVRIFDLRPNSYWFLEIVGTPSPDHFGKAVAISGDGNIMAVGEYGDAGNAGMVKMYELTSFGVTATLTGNETGDTFGHAISMSNDGSVLAVGTADKDYVKVYRSQDGGKAYSQIGTDVTLTDGAGTKFGVSLSLSYTGTRMVVGAPEYDPTENTVTVTDAGATFVFSVGSNSVNLIAAFMGETTSDKTGSAVTMSGDGKRVATGTVTNTGGKGAVRAFGKYND